MKSQRYYDVLGQYKIIHNKGHYGSASDNIQDYIIKHINFDVNSILDYGCGRSNLSLHIAERIGCQKVWKYEPAIEKYNQLPDYKVDLLLCTEVLEHIPEDDIDYVLIDLKSLCPNCFFSISTRIAGKILPNGENAHCTVKPKEWWIDIIKKHFGIAELTLETSGEGVHIKTWR